MMGLIDRLSAAEQTRRARLRRAAGGLAARLLPFFPADRLAERAGRLVERATSRLAIEASPARPAQASRTIVLVSHDLSPSGAPILLLRMAEILLLADWEVVLWSFAPGELAQRFVAAGASIVIDGPNGPGLRGAAGLLRSSVDAAICNTVATAAAVQALSPALPVLWYLHEVSALEEMMTGHRRFAHLLAGPRLVWTGSELSARIIRGRRPDVQVVPYGLETVTAEPLARGDDRPAELVVFGSFEARKGQDLLVEAFARLPTARRAMARVTLHGRLLDQDFHARLCRKAARHPEIQVRGELDQDGYRAALRAADCVVIPSRDDTLPLVSLDALGAGRVLMCTATTGTAAYLSSGDNGFVAAEATAEALAAMLGEALCARERWPAIAAAGQAVFRHAFSADAFASRVLEACDAMAASRAGRDAGRAVPSHAG